MDAPKKRESVSEGRFGESRTRRGRKHPREASRRAAKETNQLERNNEMKMTKKLMILAAAVAVAFGAWAETETAGDYMWA